MTAPVPSTRSALQRRALPLLLPLGAVLLALIVGGLVMLSQGFNPLTAYGALAVGAFGNVGNLAGSLVSATPLILAGLGIALSFRGSAFNIGAVGQMYVGAALAALIGTHAARLPAIWHIPLAIMGGAVAGAAFAAVAAFMKLTSGISEVISTILLNYVGVYLVHFLVHGPLEAPGDPNPESAAMVHSAALPLLVAGSDLNIGLLVGVGLCVVAWVFLFHTPGGYALRVAGQNPGAARHAGIRVHRVFFWSLVASGALAGMAGAIQILGVQGRLLEDFAPNMGYTAIAVALLGRLSPMGVLLSALFFGALRSGIGVMHILTGLPVTMTEIIEGLTVLAVLAAYSPAIMARVRHRGIADER